jgi:Zn ribbon nucleic-acid-binding protein
MTTRTRVRSILREMPRRKPTHVPSCPRCGNEEDLLPWADGQVYCAACLTCPHNSIMSFPCSLCLRHLYSTATFQGWRLFDVEVYVRDAWRDYGLEPTDLATWIVRTTRDAVQERGDGFLVKEPRHGDDWSISKPPPHHRFTKEQALAPPRASGMREEAGG